MSYEGGGTPGLQGPTGPTGATGGITFSGPTGSVLWYDGSGVTGYSNFKWNEASSKGNTSYTLYGGPNQNKIVFDDGLGTLLIKANGITGSTGTVSIDGSSIAGSIVIGQLTPKTLLFADELKVTIGTAGVTGQYLGSNGTGLVTWSTPTGTVYPSGLSVCPVGSNIYYIPVPDNSFTTSNAVVQTTLQIPDGSTQNWIVDAKPYFGLLGQFIFVEFSIPIINTGTTVAWTVLAKDCTPSTASDIIPTPQ